MKRIETGIRADCSTSTDVIDLLTADKSPVEICGIINKLLSCLLFEGIEVQDGDNPGDGYLDCITYNPDDDGLYFLTKDLGR